MHRLLRLIGLGSFRSSGSPVGRSRAHASPARLLRCEPLEARRLLSVAPYVVDSLADVVAFDGVVTFREALQAANENRAVGDAHAGSFREADLITFDPALFAEGPGSIVLEQGGLSIEGLLEIEGPGASTLRIETRSLSHGFTVKPAARATISGLTVLGEGKGDYRRCGVENLGVLTLSGVAIVGNSATGNYPNGGGIHNEGTLTVESCALVGNVASHAGGAVYNTGPMTILDSTIVGNSAERFGGGVYSAVPFTIVNSIVCSNVTDSHDSAGTAHIGREIYGATTAESGCNLIGVDPCFVRMPSDGGDGWGDLYQTRDVDESANDDYGDVRLRPDSPAIDVGYDELAAALATDLDGNPRTNGFHVDIGAFEYQGASSATLETPSTTVTTLEDVVDSDDGLISLREAILYAGRSGSSESAVDIHFDSALDQGTIVLAHGPLQVDTAVNVSALSLDAFTIDGDGRDRVLEAYSTSRIEGVTLTRGVSAWAPAVLNFGDLTLAAVVVRENDAEQTGAVCNMKGTLTVEDSVITRNTGGGVYNNEGTLEVRTSIISENTGSRGAGVYSLNGSSNVISCQILGNAARNQGGGVYSSGGPTTVYNSAVVGNTAVREGGGLSGADAVNSTIVANSSGLSGGGINGIRVVRNSIVYLNEAPKNADTEFWLDPSSGYSLMGIDPLFVRKPDDGGDGWADDPETPDIDERENNDYGDLRLTSLSPAVDLAKSAYLPSSISADVGGEPRVHGAQVDVGAYEFQGTTTGRETPSAVVTTVDDRVDPLDGVVSLREALLYAGLESTGAIITFDEPVHGAEIFLRGSSLFIDRSVTIHAPSDAPVTVNAGGLSSAFFVSAENAAIENLIITGGSAEYGGGIYSRYSGLTLRGCTVAGNRAEKSGGGIYHSSGEYSRYGSLDLIDCDVRENNADHRGGGGIEVIGTAFITDCRIYANSARYGGGVSGDSGSLSFINTAVFANTSFSGGGVYSSWLHLVNATIVGNQASLGAGVYLKSGATLENSIVSINGTVDGSDMYQYRPDDELTIRNTLIGTDPHFLRLPNDGGDGFGDDPTTSDADESANDDYGDLRLAQGSPAIDAGDNSYLPAEATVDLAGNPRMVGQRVDIGAYEFSLPGDLNGDGLVGSDDLEIVRAHWGGLVPPARLALGDPSGDGRVGGADLDLVRANWGATPAAAAGNTKPVTKETADAVYSDYAKTRDVATVLSLADTRRLQREHKELRHQHALIDLVLAGAK